MHNSSGRCGLVSLLALFLALAGCSDDGEQAQEIFDRARALHAQGDLPAVVIELKNTLQIDPEHREARWLLGQTYLALRDGTAARKEIERARSLGLSDPGLERALVEAMLLQGEYEDALQGIRANPAAEVGGSWLALEADSLLGLGRTDEARAAYAAALESGHDEARARRGLARLALADGESEVAKGQIDKALALADSDVETLTLKGELELSLGQHEAAQASFRAAMQAAPESVEARFRLARALLADERTDEASEIAEALAVAGPRDPRVNYLRALVARQRNDIDGALEAVREVLAVAPGHPPSLLLAAQTHFLKRDFVVAEEHARRYLSTAPGNLAARTLLGAVLIELRRLDEALVVLQEVERQRPGDPRVLAMLGNVYMSKARSAPDEQSRRDYLQRAERYSTRAAEIAPDAAGIRTQLAVTRMASGESEQAVKDLEAVVESDPDFAPAEVLLVLTHLREGRGERAREVASSLVSRHPENPVAHNLLGATYEGVGDLDKALASYRKALEVRADFAAAELNIARLALRGGDRAGARDAYEKILESRPSNVHALLGLARIASDEDRPQEAVALLEKARTGNPNALRPRLVLAGYYLRQDRHEEALEVAEEARTLARGPVSARVALLLGRAQRLTGRYQEAASTLRDAARGLPNVAEAHYQLALAEIRMGRNREARAAFERTLELAPDTVAAEMALGTLDIGAGQFDAAIARARAVQSIQPASPAGFLLEGDALLARGDLRQAVATYEQANALGESTVSVLSLSRARRLTGDEAGADRDIDAWLEKRPEDHRVRLRRASRRQVRGEVDGAIADYERILEAEPRSVIALNNLAWLYHERGDARAVELAEKALDGAPQSPEIMDTYGWILFRSGQEERGMATLERAWRAAPQNADITYHFAASLAKLGDRRRAREILEPLLASDSSFESRADAESLFQALGGAN